MAELVKERPANPIEYLASYLLKHDPQRAGAVGMQGQGMPGQGMPGQGMPGQGMPGQGMPPSM